MTKFWRIALIAHLGVGMFLLTPSVEAQLLPLPCTTTATLLSNLANGCTIDDKLFANFTATVEGGDVSAFLTLTSISDGDLLREGFFLGTGLVLPIGVTVDTPLIVGYSVTVLDPLFAITDIHLELTGSTTGTVSETVMSGLDLLASLQVGTNPLGGSFGNTADAFFEGVDSLVVLKEITNLDVFTNGNQIRQEVTQARVPEPATLALLSLGLAGLAMARRRNQL